MKKWIGPVAAVVLLGAAFGLLRWELEGVSWLQIRSGLSAVRPGGLAAALALTALNYLILTGYDALGLRFAGVHLDRARVALAATLGTAFTQGLGFPLLTGAPVRTRLYTSWGLSASEVGGVVRYYTLAFWLGFAAVASVSLLGVPAGSLRLAGGVLALGIAGFVARSKSVRAPRLLAGLAVGALDWIVASLVLWVLLPVGHGLGFGTVLVAFVMAQGLGVASRIPGGLGVFEAAFLALLPGRGAAPEVLASLLAYRAVFYVAPLILATVVLGIREVRPRTDRYGAHALGAARVASQFVPTASAALAFVLGSLLLLSGSVPTPTGRLAALGSLVPPGVVDVSHFLASLVGVGLIVVARGLQLRLDGAYTLALTGLVIGALLALSHDFHLAGTLALLTGAAVLYASRRQFYRRASLLDQPFTPSWVLAIGAVMAAAIWLGLFAFRQVDYSADLWWRFALQEDAPRFLRASVGASVALAVFVGTRLLRPAPVEEPPTDPATLDELAPVVRAAPNPAANLVFLGDKRVRRSPSGGSFVMFAPSGSSWVVMGDPVGDPAEFEALLWEVNEEADRAGADLVFYEVGPTHLPLYIDLGRVFYKLGENARVPLEGFSMEGKARGDMRQALRRLEKEGGTFDVVGTEAVEPILPRLREISDQWLESKKVREKRFSLGRFDEAYVRRFPVGVVRVNGEIVAFATLWAGTSREELSPDLIRYTDEAPKMVMDALFTHLMLWGCDQGYRWFNLGMAPFSGLETHRLAPSWQRLGSALFRFGEHFYNFQGLRTYKEKFAPVWEPRYLAAPPGPGITGVMADVTGLVSGGIRGAVMR